MAEGCGWIVSRQTKSKYIGRCYVCRSDVTSGKTRDEVWDAMEAHHAKKHPGSRPDHGPVGRTVSEA